MAEVDLQQRDWALVRRQSAREALRSMIALLAEDRTQLAPAPMPLHT